MGTRSLCKGSLNVDSCFLFFFFWNMNNSFVDSASIYFFAEVVYGIFIKFGKFSALGWLYKFTLYWEKKDSLNRFWNRKLDSFEQYLQPFVCFLLAHLKNAFPYIRIFTYKFYIFIIELMCWKTSKETSKSLLKFYKVLV